MSFVAASLRWQRGLLAAAVAGSALVFWRGTIDVFNTTKATWILLCLIAIAVAGAARIYRTRVVMLPPRRLWAPVVAMLVALALAAITSDTVMLSVVGRAGRHTGLAMYAAYLALFLVAVRTHREVAPSNVVVAVLIAAVPVVGYGALQAAGIEPFDWQLIEGGPPVFATFGNTNFFSAWLGIVAPLALAGALLREWAGWLRVGCAALGVVALGVAFLSESLQGVVAGLAGVALVGAVWLFTDERVRRWRWQTSGALVVLGGAGAAAIAAGTGPLAVVRDQAARSLETRLGKWQTALRMASDEPLLGIGLDDYADYFHAYRPQWLATVDGLDRTTDAPHNVPLDMLTSGGALLLAAYLVFVAVTVWALVLGLRRLDGQQRLLLGGLGGAWLAYQLQSLVSIDVSPLAVLHYVLAGLIVALGAAPTWREWRLPGAPEPVVTRSRGKGKGKKAKKATKPQLVPLRAPAIAALVVVGTAAAVVATVPWRADSAAQAAQRLANEEAAMLERFDRAESLGFWEPRYPVLRGEVLAERGDGEGALEAFEEALDRQPRGLSHAINVARQAAVLDEHEQARAAYQQAVKIDPKTPEVLAEVGTYHTENGSAERGRDLLERAVSEDGDDAEWWMTLAAAREATGDEDAAEAARERAREIDPDIEQAASP